MLSRLIITFLLIIFNFLAIDANAKVVSTSKVKYETESGWSHWYDIEVTFLTGYELNKATNSLSYKSYKSYAIIFFSENQAAVIEQNFSLCNSNEFTLNCFPSFGNFEGKDSQDRKWQICTSNICF